MRKRGRLVLLKSIILYHIFFVLFSHSLYTTLLPAQPAMSRWFRHIGHHRDSIHRARVVAESKKIYCQKEKRYNSHTALRRYIPTFPYSFKKSQRDPKFFFKEVFFSHFFSLSLFFLLCTAAISIFNDRLSPFRPFFFFNSFRPMWAPSEWQIVSRVSFILCYQGLLLLSSWLLHHHPLDFYVLLRVGHYTYKRQQQQLLRGGNSLTL